MLKNVNVPVKLFYGKYDWANESNRLDTKSIKTDKYEAINDSVHFSFLEIQRSIGNNKALI